VLSLLIDVGAAALVAYVSFAAFLCLLISAEMAFPRPGVPQWPSRLKAIQFNLIFIPAFILFPMLAGMARARLGFTPPISLRGGLLPPILAVLASLLVYDLCYYWFHRAQHAVPWLWRFHSIHHSAEHLGAGSGYHHLAEAPLRATLVSFPLGLLVAGQGAGQAMTFVMVMHGYYLHSSSRLNFGPLAWIISDNRTHRVHHSMDSRHFNKNFGASSLIWDKVFGTAYFPMADEWPAVGLEARREPKDVRDYLRLWPSPPKDRVFAGDPSPSFRSGR
jgi:sterol desaturase/sphingolipid hydroxylase (fatty acid hydroxylase superfamily)